MNLISTLTMTNTHKMHVQIAETLEELQHLNPDLYGLRYSQLYANKGEVDPQAWNEQTLKMLQNDLLTQHIK